MSDRFLTLTVLLSVLTAAATWAAPPAAHDPAPAAVMTTVVGKDVGGNIYKKLGLPSRRICWDSCLKDDRCTGARWGVVGRDTAGMCILMTGELASKDLVELQTEDGQPIHVVVARKQPASSAP